MLSVPVMRPLLPAPSQVLPYLERMSESGIYSNFGPLVEGLEGRLANLLGVHPSQLVVTHSGTSAIAAGAASLGVTDWIVPDFTFPASALALINAGKKAHLSDVDLQTGQLRRSTPPPSVGVLYVVPFGARVDIGDFPTAGPCIVDAAASLGSIPMDLSGIRSDLHVVFSLHATKILGIGEGGLIVCGSKEHADYVRAWINFGFAGQRTSTLLGTNGKMSEVQAAYGHAALDGWEIEKSEWLQANNLTLDKLHHIDVCHQWSPVPDCPSPYWIVRFETGEERDFAEKALLAKGVQTRRWWTSLHQMQAFTNLDQLTTPINSLRLSETLLGLPMWRGLEEETVSRILEVLSHK